MKLYDTIQISSFYATPKLVCSTALVLQNKALRLTHAILENLPCSLRMGKFNPLSAHCPVCIHESMATFSSSVFPDNELGSYFFVRVEVLWVVHPVRRPGCIFPSPDSNHTMMQGPRGVAHLVQHLTENAVAQWISWSELCCLLGVFESNVIMPLFVVSHSKIHVAFEVVVVYSHNLTKSCQSGLRLAHPPKDNRQVVLRVYVPWIELVRTTIVAKRREHIALS